MCSIFLSLLSASLGLYLISLFIYYYNHDYTQAQHQAELKDYRYKQGWIYGAMYIFLSIYCIAGYAFLYKTMANYFGNSLQKERKSLNQMFFVFTTAFVLYAIYCCPQGYYDDFICERYEREILLDTITLILDFTVIIAVLNLHRTTYKDNAGVP